MLHHGQSSVEGLCDCVIALHEWKHRQISFVNLVATALEIVLATGRCRTHFMMAWG
jgi:hypothetical protein